MGCGASVSPENQTAADLATAPAPSEPSKQELLNRVVTLEEKLRKMEQALATVQKDCRRTVSVLQYNILASYLGLNTQPWFLYGADIDQETRERIFNKYYERDETGVPKHRWPAFAEGILSPEQVAAVERRDNDFQWEQRKRKLLHQLRQFDADIVSLVELDKHEYFAAELCDTWDSVFHKRPRAASLDGCGVFWRRSKFMLAGMQGIDFIDGSDDKGRTKRDRSCLIVLLKWLACDQQVVVVSTHLAKDPENRSQTAMRVRQVTQIMEALTEFTIENHVEDAPVILMGDLNARHFGEIRGIARTVWQIKGSPMHKFLWSATDVSTGPTSVTKARQSRIDVVQFLNSQLDILEVAPVPKLPHGEVIPNAEHPSDHFPVFVSFRVKDTYQTHREVARSWLECVAGREKLHPLTEPELRTAFDFFDRDRSTIIRRHDLEEACIDLQCHFNVDIQGLLLDCFPEQQITYTNFIRAYEVRLNHDRLRSLNDLEQAFMFFSDDSDKLTKSRLAEVFREITPISFTDDEVDQMIGRLNMENDESFVNLHKFCEIVCNASFPHKDRTRIRMTTKTSVMGRMSTYGGPSAERSFISDKLGTLNDFLYDQRKKFGSKEDVFPDGVEIIQA